MSKEQSKDLLNFLKPFGADITDLVMWLRDFAWDLCPKTNELIYDNYNAVAFGWSSFSAESPNIAPWVAWTLRLVGRILFRNQQK